jgi:hypothetical protein
LTAFYCKLFYEYADSRVSSETAVMLSLILSYDNYVHGMHSIYFHIIPCRQTLRLINMQILKSAASFYVLSLSHIMIFLFHHFVFPLGNDEGSLCCWSKFVEKNNEVIGSFSSVYVVLITWRASILAFILKAMISEQEIREWKS